VTAYADEEFRSSHAQFYAKGKDAHPFSPEEQAESKKSDALSAAIGVRRQPDAVTP